MVIKKTANRFPIKGFREGLLIKIGDGKWEEVLSTLVEQIREKQDFFSGAKIAIDVDERELKAAELGKLRDILSEDGVTLFAVLGKSAITREVSETLGLYTEKTIFDHGNQRDMAANLSGGEDALLIQKNIRSGISIKHPGHIIIDGDVNPGAEIRAGKSIYIWGTLSGFAQAGAEGSEREVICALNFISPKMRIANIVYIDKSISKKNKKSPMKAYIENEEIIIRDWKSIK